MTGKERVRAAIAREPVDRVPLGLYAVDYDIIEKVIGRPTYVRNNIAMQTAFWEGRRDEVAESWKADLAEFYRTIDCVDVITWRDAQLMPPKNSEVSPPEKIAEDKWEDSDGRTYQAVPYVNEIRCIHDPTLEQEPNFSVEDFKEPVKAHPPDPSMFEVLDYIIEQFGQEKYIVGPSGHTGSLKLLGGFENGLIMYALHPEIVAAALAQDMTAQNQLDQYYIRPGVDAALLAEDMGGTTAPFISPAMFREICFPYMCQRVENVKHFVPQIVMHNCGHTIPLMDMFIKAGVDCYQSLQTTAGMEIGLLKEKFGDRLCFWGGVSLEILISGTAEETRKSVRTALERGAPGSGFILGPSQSIAKNTRYDNFMAMLDEFMVLRDKF